MSFADLLDALAGCSGPLENREAGRSRCGKCIRDELSPIAERREMGGVVGSCFDMS